MSGYEIPAIIASLAATGAGTGLSIAAQNSANRRREEELERIEASRRRADAAVDQSSKKQLKLTTDEVEKYAPVTRDAGINKIENKISKTLQNELDLKRGDLTDVDFSGMYRMRSRRPRPQPWPKARRRRISSRLSSAA